MPLNVISTYLLVSKFNNTYSNNQEAITEVVAFFSDKKMKLGLNSISNWFGMVMIVIVLAGAIAVSFTDFMIDRLYGTKRIFFVVLMLAYAIYRGVRIYQTMKQNRHEE